MPKLTDREIRAAKPAGRPYKRWDEGGLYLTILPSGSRSWRFRWASGGKRQVMTLGLYPDLGLADARERRNEIRTLLRQGRDPAAERMTRRLLTGLERSFEAVARDWHSRMSPSWTLRHAGNVIRSLERDVFPTLGKLHIREVPPELILILLRGIEARDAVMSAHQVRQRIGAVFDFGIDTKICSVNPTVRAKALTRRPNEKRPAIIDLPAFCAMLRKTESAFSFSVTKMAMRFLALTAVRPAEVVGATWDEFQYLEHGVPTWVIRSERMGKTKEEHVVPLARAAADLILAMKPLTGRRRHVFGNTRYQQRPIDLSTMSRLLVRLGFQDVHCPQGFRSSFATIMTKRHPADREAIEAQLAHGVPGTRGRYMRETFVERRRELAEEWASLILDGAPSADELLLGRRC
jgi:integrase